MVLDGARVNADPCRLAAEVRMYGGERAVLCEDDEGVHAGGEELVELLGGEVGQPGVFPCEHKGVVQKAKRRRNGKIRNSGACDVMAED